MALNEVASCDDAQFDAREENTNVFHDSSRDLVERKATRSRPQSLVRSHQNEYSELMTTDISLSKVR